MTTGLEIPFDRVTYRNGQRLDARDLRDDDLGDARFRQLHLRYLHDTWGIALGFEVIQLNDRREKVETDGTALLVGPGYAVDELGRDVLLPESTQPPLPKLDGRVVLTVSYREDSEFRALSDLSALCFDDRLNTRHERAVFAWRRPEEVRFGPEVPLVQMTIANGVIKGPLDSRVRRYAQPFLRPHIGVGVTEEGQSGWLDWVEGTGDELGLELKVNTSEAGFIRTPLYFPLLQGDFSNEPDKPLFEPDLWLQGEPAFSLDSLGFITGATTDSFIYRILNVGQNPFVSKVTAGEAERRRWRVAWLGLEPVRGCEPPILAKVIRVEPADGAKFDTGEGNLPRPPSVIEIFFDKSLQRATVNGNTIQVIRSEHGRPDVPWLGTVAYDDATRSAQFTPQQPFGTPPPILRLYTLTVFGDGPNQILDVDGQALDGNGDGSPGGNFTSTFTVTHIIS